MAGDYLFQSKEMAAYKLTHRGWRAYHCLVYTLCFTPVVLLADVSLTRAWIFLWMLQGTHYVIDSRRWRTDNPWPAMPIMHDQSLHAVQLAVLCGLFLT